MIVHSIIHVAHESIGAVEDWIEMHGHKHTTTNVYKGEALPDPDSFDLLLIMGGPMSANDNLPWMDKEKELIVKSIEAGKYIVGICLGAQLISLALGGTVTKNEHKEIGWFPVKKSLWLAQSVANYLPFHFTAFHWHGETFSIPKGAVKIMESEACANQAFIYGERTIALQFHMEMTPDYLYLMTEKGKDELVKSKYVQTQEEILSYLHLCGENNIYLYRILDCFASTYTKEKKP